MLRPSGNGKRASTQKPGLHFFFLYLKLYQPINTSLKRMRAEKGKRIPSARRVYLAKLSRWDALTRTPLRFLRIMISLSHQLCLLRWLYLLRPILPHQRFDFMLKIKVRYPMISSPNTFLDIRDCGAS